MTYTKALIPGPLPTPTPTLIATTSEADDLWPQLLSRDWAWFGDLLPSAVGQVRITSDRLVLEIEGQVVMEDINPFSPPGWWKAVDGLGRLCVVVIGRDEDLGDFHDA